MSVEYIVIIALYLLGWFPSYGWLREPPNNRTFIEHPWFAAVLCLFWPLAALAVVILIWVPNLKMLKWTRSIDRSRMRSQFQSILRKRPGVKS